MEVAAAAARWSSNCGATAVGVHRRPSALCSGSQRRLSRGFSTVAPLDPRAAALRLVVSTEEPRTPPAAHASNGGYEGVHRHPAPLRHLYRETPEPILGDSEAEYNPVRHLCRVTPEPILGGSERELSPYLSKYALMRDSVHIEIKWLLELSEIPKFVEVPRFSKDARLFLDEIYFNFDIYDALEVFNIEKHVGDDVKALQYFLVNKCQSHAEVAKVLENFRFACTFEDIYHLTFALGIREALCRVILPTMFELQVVIHNMAKETMSVPLVSCAFLPTTSFTLSEETSILAHRLNEKIEELNKILESANFTGGVAAYPNMKWATIVEDFVRSFGISFITHMTQTESCNNISKLCRAFIEFNNILLEFDQDILRFVSSGHSKQIVNGREISPSLGDDLSVPNTVFDTIISLLIESPRLSRQTHSKILRQVYCGLAYSLACYRRGLEEIRRCTG